MTIEMSIPDIFRLLKDKYLDIREAAAKVISELSKHGKCFFEFLCLLLILNVQPTLSSPLKVLCQFL
jgi:transposase